MSWKLARLADICEIKLGKTPSRSDKSYWDDEKLGSNIWVSIADLTKLNSRFIADSKEYITDKGASLFKPVKAGTLLMSFKLSIGKVAYANCDLYTNEAIVALPIKDGNQINSDFLFYFLKFYDWDKETENDVKLKGKTLNKAKLNEIKVPVPPLSIQQEIVAKLDAIFSEIDKATAAAVANAKNAEALFQSYLIQVFDDFGKNYISDTIGKVCTLRSGTTVNSSLEKTEGEIPYLKVADMNLIFNQEFITTSSRFLNKSDINKKSVIPKGSTIFPKRGGAIDTNKKRITDVDIAVDLNIMSVYPSEKINPYLLYFYFLSLDMKKLGSGSSIRQINNYDIEPLVINFPESMDEQLKLVNRISNLKIQSEKLSLNYKNKKSELSLLKQSILKKAFIGELVKE